MWGDTTDSFRASNSAAWGASSGPQHLVDGWGDPAVSPEFRDIAARVVRNLPPALWRDSYLDREDLLQEALLAVHDAAGTFDSSRNVPFFVYATTCARNAVLSVLRGQDPFPETVRRDLKKIIDAEDELILTLERCPTDEEVSAACGVSVERIVTVRWWQQRGRFTAWDVDVVAQVPDRAMFTPEEAVVADEESRQILEGLAGLSGRARRILWARLVEEESVTAVAEAEGVSVGRVSQVTRSALKVLAELLT